MGSRHIDSSLTPEIIPHHVLRAERIHRCDAESHFAGALGIQRLKQTAL